ncbi:FLYWCH zinc finger domain-containing protein [Phthorimaea operculella]|nr:FLYWCH zinc finger domain-containing protein [Phthorimaea operculella]
MSHPITMSNQIFILVLWVKNQAGRQLALIGGYTYYLNNNSWRCTKGHSCRARFLLDKQMNMVSSNFQHDHTAPRYIIKNGVYFKI